MWWTISFRFADRRTVSWNKQNLDIWVNCPENIGGGVKVQIVCPTIMKIYSVCSAIIF